jgi:pyruvate dehydrogenase E1 component
MMIEQKDVFYYITLMNENYAQPDLDESQHEQVLKGCYRLRHLPADAASAQVVLMGSGAILTEVIKAAEQLHAEGVGVDVYSVTSWSELARDGTACEAAALSGKPGDPAPVPYLQQQLGQIKGPVIAATDYVRAVPETIRAYLPPAARYLTLGTDGFGRSDTRAVLREFFHVDAASIAQAARRMLAGPVCGR